jgi:hypothetical protein
MTSQLISAACGSIGGGRNGRDWLRRRNVLLRALNSEIRQANRLRQPIVARGDLTPDLSEGGTVHSKNSNIRP